MDTTKATARPWITYGDLIYSQEGAATICAISAPRGGDVIKYVELGYGTAESKEAYANAALIVEAVNSFDAAMRLAEAAETLIEAMANGTPEPKKYTTHLYNALAAFEEARKGGK